MNEQISALLDDEIALEDAAHIINAMLKNKDAAQAWSQYNLIGDAMRGNAVLSQQFKQNLMQKIQIEPTVLSPNTALVDQISHVKHANKLPTSWAIAASFAAVIVVGFMLLNQQTHNNNELAPMEVAQADVSKGVAADEGIPTEYLNAHQASAPSASAYYIQTVSY